MTKVAITILLSVLLCGCNVAKQAAPAPSESSPATSWIVTLTQQEAPNVNVTITVSLVADASCSFPGDPFTKAQEFPNYGGSCYIADSATGQGSISVSGDIFNLPAGWANQVFLVQDLVPPGPTDTEPAGMSFWFFEFNDDPAAGININGYGVENYWQLNPPGTTASLWSSVTKNGVPQGCDGLYGVSDTAYPCGGFTGQAQDTTPTPPVLTGITLLPAIVNVQPGQSFTVTATGYDQNRNEMSGLTFTFTPSGNGLYTLVDTTATTATYTGGSAGQGTLDGGLADIVGVTEVTVQ